MQAEILPAAAVTTIGLGSSRKVWFPENLTELKELVKRGLYPLGGGSNLVLKDEPDRELLSLKFLKKAEFNGNHLKLGAGVTLREILTLQSQKGFLLLEFLAGIPRATVGGLIAQNAGAFKKEVKELLESVTFITYNGEVATLTKSEIEKSFGYRESPFPKTGVVVEAVFRITPSPVNKVKRLIRHYLKKRLEKQPPPVKTAGSTFKNTPAGAAGLLLDRCGLKGFRVGGVKFSEKHANFTINEGGSFKEFEELIEIATQRVYSTYGVKLELEVKVV